jgi:hypothetical protein
MWCRRMDEGLDHLNLKCGPTNRPMADPPQTEPPTEHSRTGPVVFLRIAGRNGSPVNTGIGFGQMTCSGRKIQFTK